MLGEKEFLSVLGSTVSGQLYDLKNICDLIFSSKSNAGRILPDLLRETTGDDQTYEALMRFGDKMGMDVNWVAFSQAGRYIIEMLYLGHDPQAAKELAQAVTIDKVIELADQYKGKPNEKLVMQIVGGVAYATRDPESVSSVVKKIPDYSESIVKSLEVIVGDVTMISHGENGKNRGIEAVDLIIKTLGEFGGDSPEVLYAMRSALSTFHDVEAVWRVYKIAYKFKGGEDLTPAMKAIEGSVKWITGPLDKLDKTMKKALNLEYIEKKLPEYRQSA
ncbi:hypothetical protein KY347_06295 [Candidatus Woesearchaeota archaeon]|nr:hypothetical protein [Candidatus Woesearchaeota archaeon]